MLTTNIKGKAPLAMGNAAELRKRFAAATKYDSGEEAATPESPLTRKNSIKVMPPIILGGSASAPRMTLVPLKDDK